MRLHKIWVEKISLFHLKKRAVNYFCLLSVIFQVNQFDLCINQSLDKHSFERKIIDNFFAHQI